VQQQPHDFFVAGLAGQLMNVITSIKQTRVGIHPTDGGFASNDSFETRTIGGGEGLGVSAHDSQFFV
jgi:hypothetical protein